MNNEAPLSAQRTEVTERLKARIYGLTNRGENICQVFQLPPEGDLSCARCGYPADTHLLRDCLDALLASPAPQEKDVARRIRAYLWLSHGHSRVYGDDGEMQCGECGGKYRVWDYKRAPLGDLIEAVEQARQEHMMKALAASQPAPAIPENEQSLAERLGARKVTAEELRPFIEMMEDEVIPAIAQTVFERQKAAAKARQVVLKGPPITVDELHVALETERTMRAAWEKRAYEAEAQLAGQPASATGTHEFVDTPGTFKDSRCKTCRLERNHHSHTNPTFAASPTPAQEGRPT